MLPLTLVFLVLVAVMVAALQWIVRSNTIGEACVASGVAFVFAILAACAGMALCDALFRAPH